MPLMTSPIAEAENPGKHEVAGPGQQIECAEQPEDATADAITAMLTIVSLSCRWAASDGNFDLSHGVTDDGL
jgi:hypothetical protein